MTAFKTNERSHMHSSLNILGLIIILLVGLLISHYEAQGTIMV